MKVLIVDDETPARDRLRQLLEDDPEHSVIGEAANGVDAITAAADLKPDVVLLDIRMPGLGGIEAAHHLNSLENPPAVVFTTAYDEYAIDAFEANAIGYVLKPIRRERLEKALKQAARISGPAIDDAASRPGMVTARTHVCARVRDELRLIAVKNVHLFVADQKYVRVCHAGGENLIDDSLNSLEREFPELLVRIHRSALVALAHIESLEKTADGTARIVLRSNDGTSDHLIISRRHLADVKRRLKGA